MKIAPPILVLLLFFSLSQESYGSNKYEYELPTLIGPHSQSVPLFNIPFTIDKFQEIFAAQLLIEGEAMPGSATRSAGGIDIPVSLQVEIHFQIADTLQIVLFGYEGMPVVEFGPLNGKFKDEKPLKTIPADSPIDWSFAKKGKGVVVLRWGTGCHGFACSSPKIYSRIDITKAKLVIDGVLQSDARSRSNSSDKEMPDSSKLPRIRDHFACSDYCPGPKERYMVKIYEGVTNSDECRKLGGRPSAYVGWGTFHICIAE